MEHSFQKFKSDSICKSYAKMKKGSEFAIMFFWGHPVYRVFNNDCTPSAAETNKMLAIFSRCSDVNNTE